MRTSAVRSISRPIPDNHRGSPFWLLSPAEQRERLHKLLAQRMSLATIASITRLSVAEIERMVEARA